MKAHSEGGLAKHQKQSTAPDALAPTYLSSQTPRFPALVDGIAIEQGREGTLRRTVLDGESDEFSP